VSASAQVGAGGQVGVRVRAGAAAGARVGAGEQSAPVWRSVHSRPLRISAHSVMTIVRSSDGRSGTDSDLASYGSIPATTTETDDDARAITYFAAA
jgi:hypothetical protein